MTVSLPDLSRVMRGDERYFFTPKVVKGFRNEKQGRTHHKPWGLWYACGDSWLQWILRNYPEWSDAWSYLYKVDITDEVLHLSSRRDIADFDRRYRFEDSTYRDMINWADVAKDFPGLEICPHQPRYNPGSGSYKNWYDSWDVASGCIWDERGLVSMQPVARKEGDVWALQ